MQVKSDIVQEEIVVRQIRKAHSGVNIGFCVDILVKEKLMLEKLVV